MKMDEEKNVAIVGIISFVIFLLFLFLHIYLLQNQNLIPESTIFFNSDDIRAIIYIIVPVIWVLALIFAIGIYALFRGKYGRYGTHRRRHFFYQPNLFINSNKVQKHQDHFE